MTLKSLDKFLVAISSPLAYSAPETCHLNKLNSPKKTTQQINSDQHEIVELL